MPFRVCYFDVLGGGVLRRQNTFGPGACACAGANTFGNLGVLPLKIQAYTPTDVLGRSPATDVLDVRYPPRY